MKETIKLAEWLKIEKGITAVIGSGGKTSLLHALAEQLPGTVILCTTTLMYPSDVFQNLISPPLGEIERMLKLRRVICIGEQAEQGKITQPDIPLVTLSRLADYVLVEADGAKQRPLKAHLPHEPMIPTGASQTICVVGASGFGEPINRAVHRSERFAELTGAQLSDSVTPEMVAEVLKAERLGDRILINQVETKAALKNAKRLAQKVDWPVVAGSLKNKIFYAIKAQSITKT